MQTPTSLLFRTLQIKWSFKPYLLAVHDNEVKSSAERNKPIEKDHVQEKANWLFCSC